MERNTIMVMDCLEGLKSLPDGCVHCVVTSPPYWGLRDYGVEGQIGLEENPEEYLRKMVAIFQEVRRVLRSDGTLWLNMGDGYAGKESGGQGKNGERADRRFTADTMHKKGLGLKPKDLIGMPWRLAFALQADGWYLRSDIIWHKPNPMPESCRDRPTKAHEYLFLLTKSPNYYYDQRAILEKCSPSTHDRISQDVQAQIGSDRANGNTRTDRPMKAVVRVNPKATMSIPSGWDRGDGAHKSYHRMGRNKQNPSFTEAVALQVLERNKRTVWTVATKGFKDAHFATYPPALITPCVLAGCPPGGVVLDPFMGAGTTALVARQHGRDFLGFEINPEYQRMAMERLRPWLEQERLEEI